MEGIREQCSSQGMVVLKSGGRELALLRNRGVAGAQVASGPQQERRLRG